MLHSFQLQLNIRNSLTPPVAPSPTNNPAFFSLKNSALNCILPYFSQAQGIQTFNPFTVLPGPSILLITCYRKPLKLMHFKDKMKIFIGLLQSSSGKNYIWICKNNASQSLYAPSFRVAVISTVLPIISQLALTYFHQQMCIKKAPLIP